jgi:hypothetical protein
LAVERVADRERIFFNVEGGNAAHVVAEHVGEPDANPAADQAKG